MSVHIPSQVKDPELLQQRRAQIVAAAVALFADKGFHKTTTRELAKASGLSTGALYEYVESKEDVLFLVCQHIHREMESHLRGSLSEHSAAADRLRHALLSLFAVVERMQVDVLLIYQESNSLPPRFLTEVLQHEQAITGIFERLLRDGIADRSIAVDPDAIPLVAHHLVVTGEMWAFRRWALRELPFAQFAKSQVELWMKALTAPPMASRVPYHGQEEIADECS